MKRRFSIYFTKIYYDKIKEYVYPLKTCDNLCIAGGVAFTMVI